MGSGGVVEGSVGVMGSGLLLPGGVVLSAVVAAGPLLMLVVTTEVEGREVEGRVGGVLGAAPAELVLGAGDTLVPSDVPAVTSGWVGGVAAEVGLGDVVVAVLVALGCSVVLAGEPTLPLTSNGGLLGAARVLLVEAAVGTLGVSGVEAPVSGLEGGTEAVSVVGSSVGVSTGVREVEGAEVTEAFVAVVPAKRWGSKVSP